MSIYYEFIKYMIVDTNTQKIKVVKRVREQTQQLLTSTRDEQTARQEVGEINEGLERKNKEMEQFAYMASHDLRQPFRTPSNLVGFLQKQYKGQLDEKADTYFNFILDASNDESFNKSLPDYSRISSKKELEQVDCKVVSENVVADLHVAIQDAKAVINYDQFTIDQRLSYRDQTALSKSFDPIKFRKTDTLLQIEILGKKLRTAGNSYSKTMA